jgi:Domain of unknown function (DUF4337)
MSGHGAHVDPNDPFQKRVAVAMAIYAVQLAFVNMLTTQARTQAILQSNRAASRWAYFQSKGMKQNVAAAEVDLLAQLPPAVGATGRDELLAKLRAEGARYEAEKATIQEEAKAFETQSAHAEHMEHFCEYGAIAAELAIVSAGVALLMHSKKVLTVSVAMAIGSLLIVAYTHFLLH